LSLDESRIWLELDNLIRRDQFIQLSSFRLCKLREIIKDNNDDLFEELLDSNRLAYSDDNKRELRKLKRLLTTK